jgi:hypothetical protein
MIAKQIHLRAHCYKNKGRGDCFKVTVREVVFTTIKNILVVIQDLDLFCYFGQLQPC